MTEQAERLAELASQSQRLGPEDLTFVAGDCDAASATALNDLLAWLAHRAIAWAFLESTHQMRLSRAAPTVPSDISRLISARWFGTAGDFQLWREATKFHWRFIGPPGPKPPGAGDSLIEESLLAGPQAVALLWPADDARILHTDADARAALRPRTKDPRDRLALSYRPYYDRGVLAATWYLNIDNLPVMEP